MKVKLMSLVKGILYIKPNAGLELATIALSEGKSLEFDSVEKYNQYEANCKLLIASNFLKIVTDEAKVEEKKEVSEKKEVEQEKSEKVEEQVSGDQEEKRGRGRRRS